MDKGDDLRSAQDSVHDGFISPEHRLTTPRSAQPDMGYDPRHTNLTPPSYPATNPKTIGAIVAMVLLGGGTAYGTATTVQSKNEMQYMIREHMGEGHPEIKELEKRVGEMERLMRDMAVSNERMLKRADITLLLLMYNQEFVAYINNGKKGDPPAIPAELKRLQFDLIQ